MIVGIDAPIWMFYFSCINVDGDAKSFSARNTGKELLIELGAMIKEHAEIWRDVKNNEERSGLGSKVF